jgi:hypothetical protein
MKITHLILLGILAGVGQAEAQQFLSKAFTYQGQIKAGGTPADGRYDLQFKLWNHAKQTVATALEAGPVCVDNVLVINGLFSVQIDFGSSTGLFNGEARWLEVGVRQDAVVGNCNTSVYEILSPRQALTAMPYAAGLALPFVGEIASSSPAVTLRNSGTGNTLLIRPGADAGEQSATSGAVLIDNSNNPRVGLHLYSEAPATYAPILVEVTNPSANVPAIEVHHLGTGGFTPAMLIRAPSPQIEMYETDEPPPSGKFEMQVQGDIFFINGRNAANSSFDNVIWVLRPATGFDGNVGIGANPYQIEKLTIGNTSGGPPRIALKETTSPTATPGYGKLYVKSSDSRLYFMDDSGVETAVTMAASTAKEVTRLQEAVATLSTLLTNIVREKDRQIEELQQRIQNLEEKMK